MREINFGKIYSRCDGAIVYNQYVVLLKRNIDSTIDAINVETGYPAIFSPFTIDLYYREEK